MLLKSFKNYGLKTSVFVEARQIYMTFHFLAELVKMITKK